jgi:eukaryotic-like serine/threonine-protein kinase
VLHNGVMPLPEQLGRLQRVSRLGSGGFATVWLYRDETLDSLVAVKALAENWAQRADVSERFLEEARVLRRADSDHVVRVYDIGENDGRPYFVMSYADQGTVGDLVERAPLPPQEVADIVWQAAQGLDVLHRMGIVHRDVKPHNLLLQTGSSGETRLVVADLGVAKALAFSTGLTLVVGTPEYMAPEQVDPAGGVDARADIHALAAVAYHLLTGSPVRTGGLESVMNPSSPGPPSLFVPNISRELDQVLAHALSADRNRRHPDVLAFASEFGQATYYRPGDPRRAGAGTAWPGAAALGAPTQVGLPVVGAALGDSGPTAMQPAEQDASATVAAPHPAYPTPPPGAVPDDGDGDGGDGRGGAGRGGAGRRIGFLLLTLAVIAVAALGGYWLATRGDGADSTADNRTSTPGKSTAPGPTGPVELSLPAPWAETEREGSTVTYREPNKDLLARVSATPSQQDVQTVAQQELDRVSVAAGYRLISSRTLPAGQRPGWDDGWLIEYGYVLDGQQRVQQAWYVGNDGATSGFVAVAAPDGKLGTVTHLLPTALEALPA